jgi:hypothetical protein
LFKLYVFTIPAAQEPIVLKLRAWDKLKTDERVVHQTIRRIVGIAHTPLKLTINADHPAYQPILALGMTTAEMAEDYAHMDAQAKKGKAAIALIDSMRAILNG